MSFPVSLFSPLSLSLPLVSVMCINLGYISTNPKGHRNFSIIPCGRAKSSAMGSWVAGCRQPDRAFAVVRRPLVSHVGRTWTSEYAEKGEEKRGSVREGGHRAKGGGVSR